MQVCGILDRLFGKSVFFLSRLNFLKTINLFKIEKDNINLGADNPLKLYGCKIESDSNRLNKLNNLAAIAKDIKFNPDESQIFIYFAKNDLRQCVYVYSYSLPAIEQISHEFNVKRMSGKKIIMSIFEIFMIGRYDIDGDNRLRYSETPSLLGEYFIPWDMEMASGKFQAKIQSGLDNCIKRGTIYQATHFYNRHNFSVADFFLEKWEGVFGLFIDLSPIATMAKIRQYESKAKIGDKNFSNICHSILNDKENSGTLEEIEEKTCIVNAFLYLKSGSENALNKISYLLGMNFQENWLSGPSVMGKTLMLSRDFDFDALVPIEYAEQFFQTTHKKATSKDNFVYFCGKDISGNYVDYSLDDSTSPHIIYTGRTGAGKSRQAINGLEQILGFDKKTGFASRFGKIKVRYTDVGFSCGNMALKLQEKYGDKVKIYPAKVSGLKFSLFDIDIINGELDKDHLKFMISLVNFALDIQGQETGVKTQVMLSSTEQEFLERIVSSVILGKKFGSPHLSEFENEGGYEELLSNLYSLGFDQNTEVHKLPEEYDYLKRPILDDIIAQVGIWAKKEEFSDLEKQDLVSLDKKLSGLKSLSFLNFHSNMSRTDESFTHIDFDEIKDSPIDFCIIYWLLVKEWIAIMKKEAKEALRARVEVPITLFYVDEAHNFFDYKDTFGKLLEKATKEFRKYGGKFAFLSQELSDAPEKVISQIGTKIFVVAPQEKDKLREVIASYFGEMDSDDREVMEKITDYMMFIMYDKGSLGLKFDSDREDDWFYKPNHPDF